VSHIHALTLNSTEHVIVLLAQRELGFTRDALALDAAPP
jgi:hypothetical protein